MYKDYYLNNCIYIDMLPKHIFLSSFRKNSGTILIRLRLSWCQKGTTNYNGFMNGILFTFMQQNLCEQFSLAAYLYFILLFKAHPWFLSFYCLPVSSCRLDLHGSNWHKHFYGKGKKTIEDTQSLFIGPELEVTYITSLYIATI